MAWWQQPGRAAHKVPCVHRPGSNHSAAQHKTERHRTEGPRKDQARRALLRYSTQAAQIATMNMNTSGGLVL